MRQLLLLFVSVDVDMSTLREESLEHLLGKMSVAAPKADGEMVG